MLNQKPNEALMRTERRAMNADRDLVCVIAVLVAKIKIARLSEIDLICRYGKLAADHAPRLHVDLRAVKGRFVSHFDIVDAGILENVTSHLFGLFPKLWFIDKFLSKLRGIVRREAHQIFVDPE